MNGLCINDELGLQSKLEERRRSVDNGGEDENSLQLMERRGLRQFSRADEYLYAMKEDLAEWLNVLYPWIDMNADNFMDRLETGEHLIRVRQAQCALLKEHARPLDTYVRTCVRSLQNVNFMMRD